MAFFGEREKKTCSCWKEDFLVFLLLSLSLSFSLSLSLSFFLSLSHSLSRLLSSPSHFPNISLHLAKACFVASCCCYRAVMPDVPRVTFWGRRIFLLFFLLLNFRAREKERKNIWRQNSLSILFPPATQLAANSSFCFFLSKLLGRHLETLPEATKQRKKKKRKCQILLQLFSFFGFFLASIIAVSQATTCNSKLGKGKKKQTDFFFFTRTPRVTLHCTTRSRKKGTTCWPSCWRRTRTSWWPTTTASTPCTTRHSGETQGTWKIIFWVVRKEKFQEFQSEFQSTYAWMSIADWANGSRCETFFCSPAASLKATYVRLTHNLAATL